MKNCTVLPDGYEKIFDVDLKKNKKQAIIVNLIAIIIAVAVTIAGAIAVPISSLFDMSKGLGIYFARFAIIIFGSVLYIVLHELVHGVFMRGFSGVRPHYGFTLLYAYAGSDAYFNKVSYIIIALAPVVIWGIVLAAIVLLLPREWFWPVYFIEIMNLSGAGGDIYVTCRFLRLPSDILVRDTGVEMTVYSKSI
ncbi:MAG: DUF3267 domain-containing protein [Eubacteriales bacterium]